MALSIKNEEAYRLAKELAVKTGDSITAVVTKALREKLDRIERRRNQKACAEELMSIGKRCANHAKQATSSRRHAELLYDEQGLPK